MELVVVVVVVDIADAALFFKKGTHLKEHDFILFDVFVSFLCFVRLHKAS